MRVFNLAEELEKERKKNKELKKEIEKLTAESTEWEERTYCWQDRAEDLQIIIDKAIEYIKKEEHSNWVIYGRTVLLKILKGNNKYGN